MKIRGLLVMLLILMGLAAFVYFYEIEGGKKRTEEEKTQKKILQVEETKIQEIAIFHGDEQVRGRRLNSVWSIVTPVETEADQYEWNAMSRALQDLSKDKEIEIGAAELGSFGLDKPRVKVSLKGTDGKEQQILFGDDNPTQSFVYVKVDQSPMVYLVASYSFRLFDKKFFDLRDKGVFKFDQAQVEEVLLRNPEGTISLKKKGDDWEMDTPIQARADKAEVDSLLSSLNGSSAKEIIDQPEAGLMTGLDQPVYELKVVTGKERAMKRLLVGGLKSPAPSGEGKAGEKPAEVPADATFYARDESRKPLLIVDKGFVDKLAKKAADLRDKSIVRMDRSKLKQLEIVSGTENIVLVKSGEDWLTPDKKKKAKTDLMSTLLSGIEYGKAKSLLDPPFDAARLGLDKPEVRLIIEQEGLPRQELWLGKDAEDGSYLQLSGEKTVKVVEKDLRSKIVLKASDLLIDNKQP